MDTGESEEEITKIGQQKFKESFDFIYDSTSKSHVVKYIHSFTPVSSEGINPKTGANKKTKSNISFHMLKRVIQLQSSIELVI